MQMLQRQANQAYTNSSSTLNSGVYVCHLMTLSLDIQPDQAVVMDTKWDLAYRGTWHGPASEVPPPPSLGSIGGNKLLRDMQRWDQGFKRGLQVMLFDIYEFLYTLWRIFNKLITDGLWDRVVAGTRTRGKILNTSRLCSCTCIAHLKRGISQWSTMIYKSRKVKKSTYVVR